MINLRLKSLTSQLKRRNLRSLKKIVLNLRIRQRLKRSSSLKNKPGLRNLKVNLFSE
jgi:hypothetical protein